jgi:hypothetical protein
MPENQSKPQKRKNPNIAFLLSVLITGLGNYFYVATPEQKKVGRNYFLSGLFLYFVVVLIYTIWDIPDKSDTDRFISLITRSIGYGLTIGSGLSAYKASKKYNEELEEQKNTEENKL